MENPFIHKREFKLELLESVDWGLIDYEEALKKQELLLEDIFQNARRGVLVFCQHPPIVTLGRATQAGDVTTWSGPTLEVSRGGRATYHGPSQLVIYPLINLAQPREQRPTKDIGAFLRNFETGLVEVLRDLGIEAQGRSLQQKAPSVDAQDETGVWTGTQKIASLGIGVRKWVSFHGAALNVYDDPRAFQGLNPCGFNSSVMTNIEALLKQKIELSDLKSELRKKLSLLL